MGVRDPVFPDDERGVHTRVPQLADHFDDVTDRVARGGGPAIDLDHRHLA